MGWVKLDDQFYRHPKVLQAGPLAGWLHVCALNYAAQYLTDGFIPKAAVNGLADFTGDDFPGGGSSASEFVVNLVDAGLWSEVDGGYQIHDYLEYNPSREEVQKRRGADLERKRNGSGVAKDSDRNPGGVAADSMRPVPRPLPVPLSTEDDPPTPLARGVERQAVPKPTPKPKPERVPITDAEMDALMAKYAGKYGSPQAVREEIDLALNHQARWKNLNEKLYVDGWLRRELEHRPGLRANGRAEPQRTLIDRTGVEN